MLNQFYIKEGLDIDGKEICKVLACPHCQLGDLIPITCTESNLCAFDNKIYMWVNCKECNTVSIIRYYTPSKHPRIYIQETEFNIWEWIEDTNNNLPEQLRIEENFYKVKDYIK